MNTDNIYKSKSFSPWVFVTYNCSCKCQYCMIPEIKGKEKTMPPDTFRKMLEITERLFEKNEYNSAHFRLSGGEPLLAFKNYKDIVTEYRKKYPNQINFGMLTNFTVFNDEIADWMELNNIGMQISIDDLEDSKPLANGKSSSDLVLANIQKLQARNISFSFNTVLDIEKTKDLTKLANFVSSFKNIEWGLNASYTENDESKINEVISIFDGSIFQLVKRGFDINRKLRFYNTVVGDGKGGCSAGVDLWAIGTNLEIWPCQSLCNKEPLGYFDENIKQTLIASPDNVYFRERRMRTECSDCPVLGLCRGGCRATHESNEINNVVCQIRRNIISKLFTGYYYNGSNGNRNCNHQNCTCACNNHENGLNKIFDDYMSNMKDTLLVDTPELN